MISDVPYNDRKGKKRTDIDTSKEQSYNKNTEGVRIALY